MALIHAPAAARTANPVTVNGLRRHTNAIATVNATPAITIVEISGIATR